MKRIVSAVAALLVAGVASNAWAAGFAVTTHGARATGMATAVTAGIDDASAAFFNPANMTMGEGLRLQIGDTLILPAFEAEILGRSTQVDTVPVFPPHLYATYGVNEMFAVGLGVFSPFGLALHWPEDWAGDRLITDASFQTIYINPEVAFKYSILRLGAGVEIVYGDIELQRRPGQVVPGAGEIRFNSKLEGSAWGVGANVAGSLELLPKFLTLGFSYRSPVKLEFDNGEATFTDVPPPFNAVIADTDATAEVTLPQTLALGIAIYPTEKLWIGLDMVYYGWQSFRSLTIDFNNPAIPDTDLPKDWEYVWNYHVGAEYQLTDQFAVRLGFEYDPTPSPDETLTPDIPDADRYNFAAGIGYKTGMFSADLGYMFVLLEENTSEFPEFPATYSGSVNLIGLTLGASL